MRPSQKNRSGRSKSGRKPIGNVVNRVFESAGPEGKVRGTPQQIIDKYLLLARDAQTSSDRVAAENFLQHAEHYIRMLTAAQEQNEERRQQMGGQQRDDQSRDHQDDGDEDESDDVRSDGDRRSDGERRFGDDRGREAGQNGAQRGDRRNHQGCPEGGREAAGNGVQAGAQHTAAGGLETFGGDDGDAPALVATPEDRAEPAPTRPQPAAPAARPTQDAGDADAAGRLPAVDAASDPEAAPRRPAPRRRTRRAPAADGPASESSASETQSPAAPGASADEKAPIG